MPTLRIQHSVPSYDIWKRAFDSDPLDRKGGGVRRYQVHRSVSDADFVMIDLDFDSQDKAEAFLLKLRDLWAGPGGAVTRDPQGWIMERTEAGDL